MKFSLREYFLVITAICVALGAYKQSKVVGNRKCRHEITKGLVGISNHVDKWDALGYMLRDHSQKSVPTQILPEFDLTLEEDSFWYFRWSQESDGSMGYSNKLKD